MAVRKIDETRQGEDGCTRVLLVIDKARMVGLHVMRRDKSNSSVGSQQQKKITGGSVHHWVRHT